jgi:hypothetical protein
MGAEVAFASGPWLPSANNVLLIKANVACSEIKPAPEPSLRFLGAVAGNSLLGAESAVPLLASTAGTWAGWTVGKALAATSANGGFVAGGCAVLIAIPQSGGASRTSL